MALKETITEHMMTGQQTLRMLFLIQCHIDKDQWKQKTEDEFRNLIADPMEKKNGCTLPSAS